MNRSAFNMISYGFLFLLIDLRIQNFDILPDIIGYILFAVGLKSLVTYNNNFRKALYANIPLLIFSLFDIYQKPAAANGGGINLGALGLLAIPISIAMAVLGILEVYLMFEGIIEMALSKGLGSLADEAAKKWKEYLYLQIAILLAFVIIFIPMIGLGYLIAMMIISLIVTFSIIRFMKVCGENL